jgi:hypothetical protein
MLPEAFDGGLEISFGKIHLVSVYEAHPDLPGGKATNTLNLA